MWDLPNWEIWNSLWSRYLKAHAFIYCILREQLTHTKFAYALSFCLECKCVNGRCKEGLDGDGSCTCDLGWRGINCNVGMMLTCRTNAHTYIWMPCTIGVYIKYNVNIKDVLTFQLLHQICAEENATAVPSKLIQYIWYRW